MSLTEFLSKARRGRGTFIGIGMTTALGVAVAVLGPGQVLGQTGAIGSFQNPESGAMARVRSGEVIVIFEDGVTESSKSGVVSLVAGSILHMPTGFGEPVLEHDPTANPYEVATVLEADARVKWAFPNVIGEFDQIPEEPRLVDWWFHDEGVDARYGNIDLAGFWQEYQQDLGEHDETIIVLFDTGIDVGHEEFYQRIYGGQGWSEVVLHASFLEDPEVDESPPPGFEDHNSPRDFVGHGTAMAGIIGAIHDNSDGIAGIAYDNPLWVYKIGFMDSDGRPALDHNAVLAAMNSLYSEVMDRPSQRFVANMSFGWRTSVLSASLRDDLASRIAALNATSRCLIVAATGNEENALWEEREVGPGVFECTTGKTPDMTIKYPVAFSGATPYLDYGCVMAVGASQIIGHPVDNYACACQAEGLDVKVAWANYSRYLPPEPDHPPCSPIVDILAPGGSRKAIDGSDLSCDGLNILSTDLSGGAGSEYRWGWGTSYSTAIVSAVAAGIWSRNHVLTPAEVKRHIKAYADRSAVRDIVDGLRGEPFDFMIVDFCLTPPDPYDPPVMASLFPGEDEVIDPSGKVGAGIINAGRAIREAGSAELHYLTGGTYSADAEISGDTKALVLGGDIAVGAGATLTLGNASGLPMTILVEYSETPITISIDGTLQLQGPVNIIDYDRGSSGTSWGGMVFSAGSILETSGYALKVGGSSPVQMLGGTVSVEGGELRFNVVEDRVEGHGRWVCTSDPVIGSGAPNPSSADWNGIYGVSPLEIVGPLHISDATVGVECTGDCTLRDVAISDGNTGIISTTGGDLVLDGCAISTLSGLAIDLSMGKIVVQNGLTIDSTQGMILTGPAAGSILRDVTITGSAGIPLIVLGGEITIGPSILLDGSGYGSSGAVLTGVGALALEGGVVSKNHDLHGLVIDDCTVPAPVTDIICQTNGSAGLRVADSTIELGSGVVLSGNGTGLYLDGASAHLIAVVSEENSGPGIAVEASSHVTVRNSDVYCNATGVLVGPNATADLGTVAGMNDFSGNSYKAIANLNTVYAVDAVGNYWGRKHCPPGSDLFIGMVNHGSCLNSAP